MTASLEETLRIEGGQVLATLIRLTGDIDVAEEALQEAAIVALARWREAGPPDKPGAWLTTVARNKALDELRRQARRRGKEAEATVDMLAGAESTPMGDDRLRLMFTCCHPSLSPETKVMLTLRTIGGLSTAEIAGAFLMSEMTVAQRISRAKKKIAVAQIPYRIPGDHELPDRLPGVLAALYVIFTTGHHAYRGSFDERVDLAEEAIRLARLLMTLMPDEPEAEGLLALMLATHARRHARFNATGDLVLLPDQERSLWDHDAIVEATIYVERNLLRRRPGPYQVQAAIACLHGQASSDAETDWKQIVDLYRSLERMSPGPVVTVNRAVAEAKVFGAAAGLALLDRVSGVDGWHLYWSARADFLRQLGNQAAAADAYGRALSCEMNDSDRRFLERRLAHLATF